MPEHFRARGAYGFGRVALISWRHGGADVARHRCSSPRAPILLPTALYQRKKSNLVAAWISLVLAAAIGGALGALMGSRCFGVQLFGGDFRACHATACRDCAARVSMRCSRLLLTGFRITVETDFPFFQFHFPARLSATTRRSAFWPWGRRHSSSSTVRASAMCFFGLFAK